MPEKELTRKLDELRALLGETEWVEFKVNKYEPDELGEYISALSNAACLHRKNKGYLVFGVENNSHKLVGTNFKPRQKKIGNEELENWLATQLVPRIDFVIREFSQQEKRIVLFEIDAAVNTPVKFKGTAYIRIGSYKKRLADHPEKERKIWTNLRKHDWSAEICRAATLMDLDSEAIQRARNMYRGKTPRIASEVDGWDDATFLNKARITIDGKMTNAAIILLGKPESAHYIDPAVAQISWLLFDRDDPAAIPQDYAHYGPPFLLNVDNVFAKVRNLNYRYMPDGTLFPVEITQYDPWVIREALHNSIAHQDYELHGRINIIEKPSCLIFSNAGSFIPGDIETVIQRDAPPEVYRNPFLAHAMVNLNMIDTIGSGIKKMYQTQKNRFFPLPDYDLSDPVRVEVSITGKILDPNYTRRLIGDADLDLKTVILLDRVQKKHALSGEDVQFLRRRSLIEGRQPNIYVSARIASVVGEQARYIKNRGFDDTHYEQLVLSFIKEYGSATRKDIDALLLDKLPDVLSYQQKKNRINRLLSKRMAGRHGLIINAGSTKSPKWILTEKAEETKKTRADKK